MTGNTLSIIANRISHVLGVHGPSLTVDTACSSGLVALDLAVRALEAGDIETAIVGSVNVLAHPLSFVGFAQARMLSPYGLCRAYDNKAEGYVRAEGGAVFVLRRSDRAEKAGDRSHARIMASGVNSAGHTNGISLPSREAQAALLRSIYQDRRIDVARLAFVEGHGTGTAVGDPAEIWALGTEIGQRRKAALPVGSIKSNIGHAEPASGLLGLMKAVLALKHNYLPASLHFETPNDQIDFIGLNVSVAAKPIELLPSKKPRLAGINSFGFGGTNVHVVISDPEQASMPVGRQTGDFLLVTAHSAASLRELLTGYRSRFLKSSASDLPDLVAAVGTNRQHMRHRFAVHVNDAKSVVSDIDGFLAGTDGIGAEIGEATKDQAKTVFVFSGNGSQWAGMAVEAYRRNAAFQERFNIIDALFKSVCDIRLRELLEDPDLESKLADTRIAQPILFATQAALADTLIDLGLTPAATFGHSIGEVAAAYVAGAISLVDAVSIVVKRSRHQHKLAGKGKMAVVAAGATEAIALARAAGLGQISVAAHNAHNSTTVSGPVDEITKFKDYAISQRLAAQILDIDYPFHHPIIDAVRSAFLKDLSSLTLRACRIPFISAVTGDVLDGENLTPSYWWKNIREPVQFEAAATAAISAGCHVFVEIGPRPILVSHLRETIKLRDVGGSVTSSLVRHNRPVSGDPVRRAFAKAVTIGAAFDLDKAVGSRNAWVSLPSLPFEMTRFRYARTAEALDLYGDGNGDTHTLAGWRIDANSAVWRNHIDAHLYPKLAEHVVDGRSIMPGSAFIEIMLAVARRYHQGEPFEISNLEIVHHMELSKSRLLEVSTVVSPETGRIEIKSRDRLKQEDWTLHAVARTRKSVIPTPWKTRFSAAPAETIAASEVYRTAERFGLSYGPSFRLLRQLTKRGTRSVEVELAPAASPLHPYLNYELNPTSMDAALHGLVGLFRQFADSADTAPYVPVRFGIIQLHRPNTPIRRAMIDIERISSHSIKANIRLLDAGAEPVATLFDCRLRRSRLRPHKTLAAQSYHYEAIGSKLAPLATGEAGAKRMPALRPAMPLLRNKDAQAIAADADMILDASVYRACYDVVRRHFGERQWITAPAAGDDPVFGAFFTACLLRLETVGLAEMVDSGWKLAADCSLPSFDDLLVQFLKEDAGRSVEAILLNDAYRSALEGSDGAPAPLADGADEPSHVSEVTFEHVLRHSKAAQCRQQLALDALRHTLDGMRQTVGPRPIHIVELCASSKTLSRRLAEAAGAANARLTVIETNERLRNELELTLHDLAYVEMMTQVDQTLCADIVVSASGELHRVLETGEAERLLLQQTLQQGGAFIGCVDAPSLYDDFVYGRQEGWYERSVDMNFPLPKIASLDEWRSLAQDIGAGEARQALIEVTGGKAISLAWSGQFGSTLGDVQGHVAAVVCADRAQIDKVSSTPGNSLSCVAMSGDETADRGEVLAALSGLPDNGLVVYFAGTFEQPEGSEALQANIAALSLLIRAMADRRSARCGLAVILSGGAPVPRPDAQGDALEMARNAGLWSFLRVARNEYPELDIHSIDLSTIGKPSEQQVSLAGWLIRSETANREWLWDEIHGGLCELRVVAGPAQLQDLTTTNYEAASLVQPAVPAIASLEWQTSDLPPLGRNDVRIEVAATALNYRDVMWAIGVLPEEALEDGFAGPSIGMECSGRIVAVGEDVEDLAVGDSVMAVATNAFSTHVVTSTQGVAKLPVSVSPVAGATLPVAFLTAYYALMELAGLRAGETVLVHGGAGGVGLAALQIVKACGAKVIATAGTDEKRNLLLALGADHVLDSRSLNFVGDIRSIAEQGVDVVLNSLSGDAMERSIAVLKPFGRFLELGKRDYYSDTKIGLRPFRRNISYFGIDADQLLKARADLTTRMFGELAVLFDEGKLHPIPYRAFSHDEIRDAFRLMQGSGHIGKIVVTPPMQGKDPVIRKPEKASVAPKDGVYLVVGGTRGFGLAAAQWLVERGASKIALASRRGATAEATAAIAQWTNLGIEVTAHACDATDEGNLSALLGELRRRGPLRGVLHAAMVLNDAMLANLDRERNRPVIDAKARSATLLDRLTRQDDLKEFILFSSITTTIGNPGQANYVAANGFLEGLARSRRQRGLPGLAIGFGAISDVGYLTSNDAAKGLLSKRFGKASFTAREALEKLGEIIASDPGTVGAASVVLGDLNISVAKSLAIVGSPLFASPRRSLKHEATGLAGEDIDLTALIEGKPAKEAEQIIFELVAREIAATLRVPVSEIGRTRLIREIGIDSLMAMELGMNFQQKTSFDLPLANLTEETTVGDICHKLYLRVSGTADGGSPGSDASIVEQLVGHHVTNAEPRAINK